MVIGDAFHQILDMDCRWPVSVHNARIWEDSNIQKHLAARPFYLADRQTQIDRQTQTDKTTPPLMREGPLSDRPSLPREPPLAGRVRLKKGQNHWWLTTP